MQPFWNISIGEIYILLKSLPFKLRKDYFERLYLINHCSDFKSVYNIGMNEEQYFYQNQNFEFFRNYAFLTKLLFFSSDTHVFRKLGVFARNRFKKVL